MKEKGGTRMDDRTKTVPKTQNPGSDRMKELEDRKQFTLNEFSGKIGSANYTGRAEKGAKA
jgi:hypothetical protein